MQTGCRLVATAVFLCSVPLAAQDAATVWNSLLQPAFDAERSAQVSNVKLTRDRLQITLAQGSIQFCQPVEGAVFGAAFQGQGRLEVTPPSELEAQQLRLFTGQNRLDMEFTEAVLALATAPLTKWPAR